MSLLMSGVSRSGRLVGSVVRGAAGGERGKRGKDRDKTIRVRQGTEALLGPSSLGSKPPSNPDSTSIAIDFGALMRPYRSNPTAFVFTVPFPLTRDSTTWLLRLLFLAASGPPPRSPTKELWRCLFWKTDFEKVEGHSRRAGECTWMPRILSKRYSSFDS